MNCVTRLLTVVMLGLIVELPAAAAPRLEVGMLTRRYNSRVCGHAMWRGRRMPVGRRSVSDDGNQHSLDGRGRTSLDADESHQSVRRCQRSEAGALLCTSRGVYATSDGHTLKRITAPFSRDHRCRGGRPVLAGEGCTDLTGVSSCWCDRSLAEHRSVAVERAEPSGSWEPTLARTASAGPRGCMCPGPGWNPVIEDALRPKRRPRPWWSTWEASSPPSRASFAHVKQRPELVHPRPVRANGLDHDVLPLYESQSGQALWIGVRGKDVGRRRCGTRLCVGLVRNRSMPPFAHVSADFDRS